MAVANPLLLKELKGVKSAARNFALVVAPKGTALLMSKKKIGGAAVKDSQKECGGGQVIRGRSFYEDGKLIFETVTKISDTLEKKLRDTIKKETGLQAKPELRQVEKVDEIEDASPDVELEGDEEGSEESDAPKDDGDTTMKRGTAPAPPKQGAVPNKVAEQFKGLVEQAERRLATVRKMMPANAAPLEPLLADVKTHGEAGRFKEGMGALKIFQDRANLAMRPNDVVLDTAQTKWEKAFAAAEPVYLKALRDRPAEAGKLRLLMDYVQGKAEEEDFPAALAGLQKLSQVLSKAPTVQETPKGTAPKPQVEEEEDEDDTTQPPVEDAEEEVPASTLELWLNARDKVLGQIAQFQKALRDENDPDFDAIADKGLNGVTKRFQVGLHVALMEFDKASGDAKAKARTKAASLVDEFAKFLDTDPMIKLIDQNEHKVTVTTRATLGGALARLKKILRA